MKLLIVDDEELTRSGVISSIDWKSLGIEEIYQADDGIHGLETAQRYRPEIILCDVRMPRMDGISMLTELETILPDTVSVFMSGYSDKEYLKAAIRLKAVSYIEKPINPAEVQEAILEAIDIWSQRMRSSQGATFHSLETASRLALQFTVPYGANEELIEKLSAELDLSFGKDTYFTPFIIRMASLADSFRQIPAQISRFLQDCIRTVSSSDTGCLYAEKHGQYLVYFLYGNHALSREQLLLAGKQLKEQLLPMAQYFIASGESVKGVSNVYTSYAATVILLQSGFFFAPGTLLTADLTNTKEASGHADSEDLSRRDTLMFSTSVSFPSETEFAQALSSKNQDACHNLLTQIFRHFYQNLRLLPNQVKDLYYKLFLTLANVRRQLISGPGSGSEETIADTLERCFTYQELHNCLTEKTDAFFSDLKNQNQDSPTIALIRDYISKNYSNEALSVKDISAHVFLSASYVCTYFKNETGQTLNQYLTEYRMEKAKQLLADPRYKITDISSKVGYSDGNYFGKSFKKYSGFSPSEFREKTIR